MSAAEKYQQSVIEMANALPRALGSELHLDPLIAAVIGHLPAAGSAWSQEARQAWLRMASMAFDVVYGPAGDVADRAGTLTIASGAVLPDATLTIASGQQRSKRVQQPAEHMAYDFYIDSKGYARRCDSDERVMPSDVPLDAEIYDVRRGPARQRDTIIWSDDTAGVRSQHAFVGPG
jgi:hypothetical protein